MTLRKWILCLFLSLLLNNTADAQPQYAFRITFIDKAGSPSLSNPLVFLSQRALNRRLIQGIVLNPTDQPVSPKYMDSVLTITQGKRHVTSKWLNSCVILLDDSSKILLLQNKPYITEIKYVAYYQNGLHGIKKFDEETHQSTPAKFKTTGNPAWYGPTWTQTNLVKGDCLHDAGYLGQGMLIAVLDDGFNFVNTNPGFDSLYKSGRIKDKYNFVIADTGIYGNTHGTEVLSTMAGYVPNVYVGAAPLAQYALYVTEEQGVEHPIEMDNMIAGMERADSLGADVLSSSLGYDVFFSPVFYAIPDTQFDGSTTPVAIAANYAVSKGMLLVITAGNEGNSGLLTPGDADSVITVGNVNASKVAAGNSGYGPNTDGQVKPDVCAMGNPGAVLMGDLNSLGVIGTSISTPQIAGWAACLWQGSTGRSSYQVKQAILKSSHLFSAPIDSQLGYGVPDFCAALKTLGLDEITPGGNAVSIYPNPFTQELNISLEATGTYMVNIQLTDITGKLIYTNLEPVIAGKNTFSVRVPNLAPGMYMCKLILADEVKTLKVLRK